MCIHSAFVDDLTNRKGTEGLILRITVGRHPAWLTLTLTSVIAHLRAQRRWDVIRNDKRSHLHTYSAFFTCTFFTFHTKANVSLAKLK